MANRVPPFATEGVLNPPGRAGTQSKNWKKYDKRAKKAHGGKRKSLAKQAKKYKSRYKSAVRKRAQERAKLATARAT